MNQTVFHTCHEAAGAEMTTFSGWDMPVSYPTGIFAEHQAVRKAAGLFDISHMSLFEVAGDGAGRFLDFVLAGMISDMQPGSARYTCILDPGGFVLDDLYVYRTGEDRFMIVSNAGNAPAVWKWLYGILKGDVDPGDETKIPDGGVQLQDLRNCGKDSLVAMALQGPASGRLLEKLESGGSSARKIMSLKKNRIARTLLDDIPVLAAYTGYTGENTGFEIYVHPDDAVKLWNLLLEKGNHMGVLPAGLGARDSLRIQAGLPLYGHEIEGSEQLSLYEAGYGFAVKFEKPFFIGRRACENRRRVLKKRVIRLSGSGRKSVRTGHVILDDNGKAAGTVTSFAYVNKNMDFIILAAADRDFDHAPGSAVRAARLPAGRLSGVPDEKRIVNLRMMPRFPDAEERAGWGS